MKPRTVILVAAAVSVVLLAVAVGRAQQAPLAVSWFSQRVVALVGHPLRVYPDHDIAPGPIVVWFIRDTYNPRTCLAVLTNQGTGHIYGPTAVDPASCDGYAPTTR